MTKKQYYHYYEVYCERGRTIQCDADNFSLCLAVPCGQGIPTLKEVERFLGKDFLTFNGVRYHVVGLMRDTESGWSHLEFEKRDIFYFPKAKYFLIDFICDNDDAYSTEEVSKEQMVESMKVNYKIARENGDDVPSVRSELRRMLTSANYEADIANGFGFLKLTSMTKEEWGY